MSSTFEILAADGVGAVVESQQSLFVPARLRRVPRMASACRSESSNSLIVRTMKRASSS